MIFVLCQLAVIGSSSSITNRDPEASRGSPSGSSLDMTDIDLMLDAYSDKDVIRTKTFLFVADLARKGPRFHGKKSHLFLWNLLIVGFYF